jgi:hypothetical protein
MRNGVEAPGTETFSKPTRVVFMEQHETAEAATARFLAEHPEASGYEIIVVGWLPADDA